MPRVAVIVPNYNGRKLLERCLKSLSRQTFADFETVVVDDGSTDDSIAFVKANYPQVRLVLLRRNLGFSAAINAGIHATDSEDVAFLNNDTEVTPNWLKSLVEALEAHPSAGSASSKILWDHARDTIYAAGDFFCREGFGGNIGSGATAIGAFEATRLVFSASACAALYRRRALDDVGPLSEHIFMFYEDIDLGFRMQLAGWNCIYAPAAVVYHTGTATAGIFSIRRKFLLARNELFVIARDLPGAILRGNFAAILRHQFRESVHALDEGRPGTLLNARLAAIAALLKLLRSRKGIMAARRDSTEHIASLIQPYDDIYPPASSPRGDDIPSPGPSPIGARVLIIRSAGPLLLRAIDYARKSLKAVEIDVLTMPGYERTVPAEQGIHTITYPARDRFCGCTMPSRLARQLRERRYQTALVLCGGRPEIGFLNVDLVALGARAKKVIYLMPDGSTRQLNRKLLASKFARFGLNLCIAGAAFLASLAFLLSLLLASAFERRFTETVEDKNRP
ncbi:MAG TPA: glycosyltransferase family 2 protein [bacterium]|nr:glycosyltransferase family 2 protein [bacterium]